jgi:uncharacterized membrane-anchored protein
MIDTAVERRSTTEALAVPAPQINVPAIKVPEITALFWLVKVLTTGMGEAASDFGLKLGASLDGKIGTAAFVGLSLLAFGAALWFQLRARRYFPPIYWLSVSMVAVFGTVAADQLHHGLHLSYVTTSATYGAAVALLFVLWYRFEGTLSVHSVVSGRPEWFYWGTVLATFALGTAVGDLTAGTLHLGFLLSGVLFLVAILVPLVAWRFGLNAVAAFWTAYVLTRPLGASFADWTAKKSGLDVGDGTVTLVSLVLIVALVAYLTLRDAKARRHDQPAVDTVPTEELAAGG